MLIKIVDDDQVFAKKIESMVYDGFKDIFLDYSIDCITSHFEDRYFEKGDIFFLDIDLKENNGIKIAEKIRENNSNAIIIFVSAMNDMIFDSLIVQPFYFIRKDNFDRDANLCLNLKERVSEEYLVKANEVLEKFPKSFEKKKDDLIKALFIFDYIQAKKLDIDRLNKEAQEENEMTQNKKEKDLELINYPKMNPSYSESIFYEIGKRIQEKAGQDKKIHNHIHKFLEQKF